MCLEWERQEMKNRLMIALYIAVAGVAGFLLSDTGVLPMTSKTAYRTKEPLLIAGEQKHFSVLPAGTILYFDRGWPEGHLTYHVYFNVQGEFRTGPADATMIAPLWLPTVGPEELPKLLNDYPVTKNDLVEILRARKIRKEELTQILRAWPDE
jgi:hypothetical protein